MENTTSIDENQYFAESKKAIQIVLEKEKLLQKQLKAVDKLQLVKEFKKETRSAAQYDELEKQERELERKIRFNRLMESAVPEEHKEKIKRNSAAEQLEVDNKLNELKAQLNEQIDHLENDLFPLLDNIRKLERMKMIPDQINIILESDIGENAVIPVENRVRRLNVSYNETQSGQAFNDLVKLIGSLRKIEVPKETKGLLDFLKRGRK
ncbi:hypothetical protein CVD25_06485 [Bacillus canaveralius]|uniref:Uncharacterized protein n=1 Tax=Bacillus canaveralius TaxID=1403243 RepID=A0A2N5GG45_9BACI|nr:hypothetical protein [Bacillus canaveralius]PLR79703.1 hypothetical protein CU635_21660 [Bacillus canaveralius]PLR99165.1 hypothetical protein CVD25_06485 [Bacillus canaveralius]